MLNFMTQLEKPAWTDEGRMGERLKDKAEKVCILLASEYLSLIKKNTVSRFVWEKSMRGPDSQRKTAKETERLEFSRKLNHR